MCAVEKPDVHHAYLLAGRFSKAAVVIVEGARGAFALGDSARPSSLLPVLIKDRGRLYCFFGTPTGSMDMDMVNPYVTNAAFSLELYLKVLLYVEQGRWIGGHQLNGLFAGLTKQSKAAIRTRFNSLIADNPGYAPIRSHIRSETTMKKFEWDLDVLLGNSSNAFVDFRYAFDNGVGWFAGFWELKEALISRIVELRPEMDGSA
jgi:hypothetical protein